MSTISKPLFPPVVSLTSAGSAVNVAKAPDASIVIAGDSLLPHLITSLLTAAALIRQLTRPTAVAPSSVWRSAMAGGANLVSLDKQ